MIWLGKEYVIDEIAVYIVIFNLFLDISFEPLWQFLEVSGLFDKDKNVGIAGSSVNLVISLLLGWKYGITGIFIGTMCSSILQLILKTRVLYHHGFRKNNSGFLYLCFKMISIYVLITILLFYIYQTIAVSNAVWVFIIRLTIGLSTALDRKSVV